MLDTLQYSHSTEEIIFLDPQYNLLDTQTVNTANRPQIEAHAGRLATEYNLPSVVVATFTFVVARPEPESGDDATGVDSNPALTWTLATLVVPTLPHKRKEADNVL